MRLSLHSNRRAEPFTHALTGLSFLLAAACGAELPPEEEVGTLSTLAAPLNSCSPDVTPPDLLCQPEGGVIECVSTGYQVGTLYSVKDNCEMWMVHYSPVWSGSVGPLTTGIAAEDRAHNFSSCSTQWRVIDSTPPKLTVNGPLQQVRPAHMPYLEYGADGQDICNGWLYSRIQNSGRVPSGVPGIYFVHYTLADNAGHVTRTSRLVTELPEQGSCSEQLTAPVIMLQGFPEEKVECGRDTWSDRGALAADACGAVEVHAYNSGQDAYGPGPNSSVEGRYQMQYLAWNGQGTTSALRTVIVEDTTPPVLRLNGDMRMTHTCGSAFVDPGAWAHDSCYGNVSSTVQVTGYVNGWAEGRYTLTYVARDPGGRVSNVQKRTVDVVNCPW